MDDQALRERLPKHHDLPALLAHAADPHPRKTRRIEWIGEADPLDNPVVEYRLLTGQYTEQQKKAIRWAAATARTRGAKGGLRNRLMEAEHRHAEATVTGLRRTYYWTRENNYVCAVDFEDVDRILGDPHVGHEFRDLDAYAERGEPVPPAHPLPPPPGRWVSDPEAGAVGSTTPALVASR